MTVIYIFFSSLFGISVLMALKVWELKRGAKPFSVLRYRLDIIVRNIALKIRSYTKYLSVRTFWLTLAFMVAKLSKIVSIFVGRIKMSKTFRLVKGKILPQGGGGAVSAFLKDVAEFKREAVGESEKDSDIK